MTGDGPHRTTRAQVHAIHNATARQIVASIVRPTINAGGDMADVMVLLETVVTGVLTVAVRLGGDRPTLDVFLDGVRNRMTAIRLGDFDGPPQ
jgi:hypothetical protein